MQNFNFDCTELTVQIESGLTWSDRLTMNMETNLTLPRKLRPTNTEHAEQVRWVVTIEEAKPAYSIESILTVGKARRLKPSGAHVTTYLAQIFLNPTQIGRLFDLVVSGMSPTSLEISVEGLEKDGYDEATWGVGDPQDWPIIDFGFSWSKSIPPGGTTDA